MRLRFPGGMYGFIIKRLLLLVPIFFAVTIVVFLLLPLTGDPARQVALGMGRTDITPEVLENFRHQFGFIRPLPIQYIRYLTGYPPADPSMGENALLIPKGLLRGDLGWSYTRSRPVLPLILSALPQTLELTFTAFVISLVIGVLIGIISALRRKTWVDYTSMGGAIFGVSMPFFWQGMMMILIFVFWLRWFPDPTGGQHGLMFLILPAVTLATHESASLARMTRSSMLDVLRQDYIRTARAKGLRERAVVFKHALKNAFIPVATLLFLRLPFLFGGTVIMEIVFNWPGMGRLLVTAMGAGGSPSKDWYIVQGGVMMFLVLAIFANLFADIMYAYLNPKIRYGEGG
jgi:ABC-type dipeptide/oligopeptide/nickel transport system permease component